jgi:copper oxidase (laccase) domain-containing protein
MYQDKNKVWRFEIFKNIKELNVGVSDVSFGNLSFNWGAKKDVIKSREKFRVACGVESKDIAVIACQNSKWKFLIEKDSVGGWLNRKKSLNCDGLISNDKIGLFLPVADCAPVVLYDYVNKVCGLIHSGSKGTERDIVGSSVGDMVAEYASDPKNILVGIGPMICPKCYVFENIKNFKRRKWGKHIWKDENGYHLDIQGKIIEELLEYGVQRKNIETSGICTSEVINFFSHRRSGRIGEPEGRFGVLVYLLY